MDSDFVSENLLSRTSTLERRRTGEGVSSPAFNGKGASVDEPALESWLRDPEQPMTGSNASPVPQAVCRSNCVARPCWRTQRWLGVFDYLLEDRRPSTVYSVPAQARAGTARRKTIKATNKQYRFRCWRLCWRRHAYAHIGAPNFFARNGAAS